MKVDLIVRILNEHIYIEHFIEYYQNIGINHIYVLTQINQEPYIFQNKNITEIIHPCLGEIVLPYLNKIVKSDADWILFVDADEYLYLKNYSSISDFISTIPSDIKQVFFQWAMVENFKYMSGERDLFDTLKDHNLLLNPHIKSLYRNDTFYSHSLLQPHCIEGLDKNYLWNNYVDAKPLFHTYSINDFCNSSYPFIIHFHTRSLQDIFIKSLTTFFDGKNIESETMNTILNEPFCMKNICKKITKIALSFGSIKGKPIPLDIKLSGCLINYDRENKLLKKICMEKNIDYEKLNIFLLELDTKYSSDFKKKI